MREPLSPELWARVSPVLDDALERPPEEWAALVEARCAGDDSLRERVMALLAAHRAAGGFLSEPVAGPELAPEDAEPDVPESIGPWRVLHELGRGGMGVVYLAERTGDQFRQRAALKLVRAGLGSDEVMARFRRERQIVAGLEHPCIARLLDAGRAADGRPYFAMEYVEGRPLTAWCEERKVRLEDRLRLFGQVCGAVQHAHSRLVVHRDLKPSNVLVTEAGEPRLLDFGIAKLLTEDEAGVAPLTRTGAQAMTPEYAAPEQLNGGAVSTATDVYALGLILHELLTGRRGRTRPSLSIADKTLRRRIAGDLDTIVMVALREEPERRYPSAEALARDVDRHLAGMPVSARPDTLAYRVDRFVRRHRIGVVAAVLLLLSLLAGLLATAWQARVAQRERDRARAAEARATAVNDFVLHELLEAATPEKSLGRPMAVTEVLDNATRSVAHAFPDLPLTEADVRLTLARSYASLGRFAEAREHAEAARARLEQKAGAGAPEVWRARALLARLGVEQGRYREARAEIEEVLARQDALLGPTHADSLETRALLGRVLSLQGESTAAEKLLREALATQARFHPGAWRLAVDLRGSLVDALIGRDQGIEAEAVCRETLAIQELHLGARHPDVAGTLRKLESSLQKQLRYADALAVARRVVEMRRALYGDKHPAVADGLHGLSLAADLASEYAESRAAEREALAIFEETLGPEHPRTVRTLWNIGVDHSQRREHPEAEAIYRKVLAIQRRTLGEDDPRTIRAWRDLNALLVKMDRAEDARGAARQVTAAYLRIAARPNADPQMLVDGVEFLLTVDPPDARDARLALAWAERAVAVAGRKHFSSVRALGLAQRDNGRIDEAVQSLRNAVFLPEGAGSWSTVEHLVKVLSAHRPPDEAERFLLEFLGWQRQQRGPDDRLLGKTMRLLAKLYDQQGRAADAETRYREALAQFRKGKPESDWEVGRAKSELGGCLLGRRALTQAEPFLVQGYDTLAADPRAHPINMNEAVERLARLHEALDHPGEARAWRAKLQSPARR